MRPIRKAAEAVLTGVSLRQIARDWNAAGLRWFSFRLFSPKGLGVNHNTGSQGVNSSENHCTA